MNDIFLSLSVGMRVLMAIAIPLVRQRIKPNRFYGVRTALTLRDDAAWYRTNRPFGKVMLVCGAGFFSFRRCPLTGVKTRITQPPASYCFCWLFLCR